MPQPKRDAVHRYFSYDAPSGTSKCILCEKRFKGKHTTNLKCHLSVKHPEEYLIIMNVNKENIMPSKTKENSLSNTVKDLCMKLVTIHGRPLAMLQDAAFQEIINIALPSNARTKHLNLNVVKGAIPEKAYEIKMKIKAEVKNKLVSLKLDSATYLDRNFLGINLQYIKNNKIQVRNLAVLEVLERQSGDFLKDKLLEVLNYCLISTSQIYSITTDNGSNFKKMTRLFTEHCCAEAQDVNNIDEDHDNEDIEDADDDEPLFSHEQGALNIDSIMNTYDGSFKPRSMLCAAHTLQLAVKDALNQNVETQVVIETARRAAKILRRPNLKNLLRNYHLNKPLIDCPTRWSSTYQMLVRLYSLKEINDCDNSELMDIFSDDFWISIENLVTCLKPINEATLALQREQLTISDFYIEWLNCKTKLETIGTLFANDLTNAMKTRETNLLNKELVLENLYLDGRLNVLLSDRECAKAKSLISQTYQQLQNVIASETDHSEQNEYISTNNINIGNDITTNNSPLENLLQDIEAFRSLPSRTSLNSFDSKLNQLRYEPRLPLNTNILKHWSDSGATTDASLVNVANCVLAAPATQVSVERLFSSVKFILNPLRSNISGSLLRDIMLIRSNSDLFN